MSKLFEHIDSRDTPIGEISLRRRKYLSLDGLDVFEVKLGDAFLMSSLFFDAEVALADLALAKLDAPELDVVVGGLGLGYTAVAALRNPKVKSLIIVDFLEAVMDWHRQGLVPLGPTLTNDPRCRFVHGDFFGMSDSIEGFDPEKPKRRFHAILLDVDHTPTHVLDSGHASFYEPEGLARLSDHLLPGGIFALWSNEPPNADFLENMKLVFDDCSGELITFYNPLLDEDSTNSVYLGTKRDL